MTAAAVVCYWCRRDEHDKCGQPRPWTACSPMEPCSCICPGMAPEERMSMMSREEVTPMAFKKHGTGQIIQTEDEQDLSKTASQDWSSEDETLLEEEDEQK